MDIKKTITTKLTIKKCHFEDGELIDENGAVVDVNDALYNLFKDAEAFDVTANLKEEIEADFEG